MRASTTTARLPIASIKALRTSMSRCRSAFSGWCAATWERPGVMFTLDTESGFDQVVFITASYGLGETVVQGAVNPDEFYLYKPNLAARPAGDPAQVGRQQGGAHGIRRRAARGQFHRHAPGSRRGTPAIFDHRCRSGRARAIRRRDRKALWTPDGYRVGPRRRRRQALHPAGAAGDGEIARGRQYASPIPPEGDVQRAGVRPRDRPEGRAGHGAARQVRGGNGQGQGGRRARRRHDRSGLGAGDEARRGDRHQSRRTHMPRGDHRPRARHSRSGRLRECNARAQRRRAGDGFVHRGRHRPRVRRHCSRSRSSRSRSTGCRRSPPSS